MYSLSRFDDLDIQKISIIILIVLIGILALGSLLLPDIFWDGFLWKYFAGPVYADAKGESVDGISEGYNPVNTLAYGFILAWAVYWIYRFLYRKQIEVNERFVLAIIPYVLLGATLRVLEDAEFFSEPVSYLMISPLIYLFLGLFTLLTVYLSILFQEMAGEVKLPGESHRIDAFMNMSWILLFGIYGLIFFWLRNSFTHIENPMLILVILGVIVWRFKQRLETLSLNPLASGKTGENDGVEKPVIYHLYLESVGWFLFAISIYHLVWWGWNEGDDLHLHVIPGILLLAFLTWGATLLLLRMFNKKHGLKIPTSFYGLNSLMIFSQFLDGAATFTGLDFYGYREKHVLPSFLIELTGTAAVMFLLKFLVLILAIYLLDIEYRKEMQEYPRLCGLIKLVVIILGLAPGTRDMLRLAFGT